MTDPGQTVDHAPHDDPADDLMTDGGAVGDASDPRSTVGEGTRTGALVPRLARYAWARRLGIGDLLVLTAMYAAGVLAGALSTELMIVDQQIGAVGLTPVWDKLATSYVGFLLYFFHLRVLLDARDAARANPRYPDRPAARGLVTPGELLLFALLLLGLETILVANVGEIRLSVWAVAIAFSFAMRFDFGLGRFFSERPFAQAIAHALAYPLVLSMLVAVAWEATITFGQFPGVYGLSGLELPGLNGLDLFTAQPVALGSLYLTGLLLALAVEIGHEYGVLAAARPKLTAWMHALLPAAGAAAAAWLATELFTERVAIIEGVLAAVALAVGLRFVNAPPSRLGERRLPMLVSFIAWTVLAVQGALLVTWFD